METVPSSSTSTLVRGDMLPWFSTPLVGSDKMFHVNVMGGRHILLLFFGSAAHPGSAAALHQVQAARDLFDDTNSLFFGITIDPDDIRQQRVASSLPGIRYFDDTAGTVSRMCGAADTAAGSITYKPQWLIVSPQMKVLGRYSLSEGATAIEAFRRILSAPVQDMTAPVLIIPDVLEPDFCRTLIALYETHGGQETGFMRDVYGKTIGLLDHRHKRRSDCEISQEDIRAGLRARLSRRIIPMIERAFAFRATRIERYIVARYDSAEGGHFASHRDNTTPATAHRRFAVTINLNGDYDGGDLRFAEYGMRTYRAPPGGAVVFSCSLLHAATKMTRGRRYATLPFLYDDDAARIREANWDSLVNKEGQYRAFGSPEPAAESAA